MAKSLNKVMLIGNTGKDPEVRYTPNNTAVASFSMATTDSWKDQSGNLQEKTEWHNLVVWGKLAEVCQEIVKKGTRIYIEGRLQTRSWEDKDKIKRYTTEIVVNELIVLSSKQSGGDEFYPPAQTPGKSQESKSSSPAPSYSNDDDDLPF